MYKQREFYYKFLESILDRWTREIERSIWAGHYESEKDRINQCFDIANCKAREVYKMDTFFEERIKLVEPEIETPVVDVPKPTVEPTIKTELVVIPEEPKSCDKHIKLDGVQYLPDHPKYAKNTFTFTPLSHLSLSSHIHNKLHLSNVKTIEQLTSLNNTQLEKILYFDEKNLLELIIELNHLGIKHNFSMSKSLLAEILPNAKISKPKPLPIAKFSPEPEEEVEEPEPEEEVEEYDENYDEECDQNLISEFEFSPRVHSRLQHAGITTLKELLSKTTTDLLNIKSFGVTHLATIINELDQYEYIEHKFKMPTVKPR